MKCNRCKAEVPRLYKSRDNAISQAVFNVCYRCYKLRARIKQASILADNSSWYASPLKELSEDEQQRYRRIAKRKR